MSDEPDGLAEQAEEAWARGDITDEQFDDGYYYTPGDRAPRDPFQVNTSYPPPVRPYVSPWFPRVVTPRERRTARTGPHRPRSGASGPWWWVWLRSRRWFR
jgi:hypothetical protein